MTDWAAIRAAGFAPPTGRADPDGDGKLVPPRQAEILAALGDVLHPALPHQV